MRAIQIGPDRSILRWVVERDFPMHVGEVCRAALDLPGEAFLAWARQRFPAFAPAPGAPGAPGAHDPSASPR